MGLDKRSDGVLGLPTLHYSPAQRQAHVVRQKPNSYQLARWGSQGVCQCDASFTRRGPFPFILSALICLPSLRVWS